MHLVNSTTAWLKRIAVLSFAIFIYSFATAQENSPYSRFGIGDIVPNQNISNRTMGGISAGYNNPQSINFINPASLGSLSTTRYITNTIFDIGGELDVRTLKNTQAPGKYTSRNALFSYLQVGFPISSPKMERKKIFWGVSFGLRPVTRINYKVQENLRLQGIDSLNRLFEGSGGINQANISTGIKIKNFSFGFSSGYNFGNKNYSTKIIPLNDTVIYYKSNLEANAHFGGVFLNTGIQYDIHTKSKALWTLGAYANIQQNLKAKQNRVEETFSYDGNGAVAAIDTVAYKNDEKGTIKMPATYGAGFIYQDKNRHWLVGTDFELTNWDAYRYYGQKDSVQNSWLVRMGAEYYPAKNTTSASKYWSFVRYRAGIYFGPDYVDLSKSRFNYAVTLGASLPLTAAQLLRRGEFVSLNTGVEIGGRGSKQSASVRENILRFNIGISMSARWFSKRNYD